MCSVRTLYTAKPYYILRTCFSFMHLRCTSSSQESCSRIVTEKLTVALLVAKLHSLHGTRKYMFVRSCQWSLSLSRRIKVRKLHITSLRYILISPCHLWLDFRSGLFSSDIPIKILNAFLFLSHTYYMPPLSQFLFPVPLAQAQFCLLSVLWI
jgi:hypothetical protein